MTESARTLHAATREGDRWPRAAAGRGAHPPRPQVATAPSEQVGDRLTFEASLAQLPLRRATDLDDDVGALAVTPFQVRREAREAKVKYVRRRAEDDVELHDIGWQVHATLALLEAELQHEWIQGLADEVRGLLRRQLS